MDFAQRIECVVTDSNEERARLTVNLDNFNRQISSLSVQDKERRDNLQSNLDNKRVRPLVDVITDAEQKAIKDVINRLRAESNSKMIEHVTPPQLYSPRRGHSAPDLKFEKAETRMLRSYLEKNDEFVNEDSFHEEMIEKYGAKILKSYPCLWNEHIHNIERLRAEASLLIKESANDMKSSLLTEKENKIDDLNLNSTKVLKVQIEKLQIESEKQKARSKSLINELTDDSSLQNDLYNLMVLTAEKEAFSTLEVPVATVTVSDNQNDRFINLKTERQNLISEIKKKTERLLRFEGQCSAYIDMLTETGPKTENSSESKYNDMKRWETSLIDLKSNLDKLPSEHKDKYDLLTTSSSTFEKTGEIITSNKFDVCSLGELKILSNRVEFGFGQLESQMLKVRKRVVKYLKELKLEYESVNGSDPVKTIKEVQSCCHETKNVNLTKIEYRDSIFLDCLSSN